MCRTFGSSDTCLTMSGWLVWQWELTQISADHVELNFNRVESLAAINTYDVANHLWHNDAVSEMSFDGRGFLSGLAILFGFFAFVVEPVVSMFDFSGKSSSLPGSEQFYDLFCGECIDLLWSVSSEGVLLESLLFFLNCGHLIIKLFINVLINFCNCISIRWLIMSFM